MTSINNSRLLIVLGSTSTGKTELAIQLAAKFNGELVACDSRQVYKGLDIGTGKAPGGEYKASRGEKYWEINGVKIWMYDAADPQRQYTVYDYVKDADRIIDRILKTGKLPIIVGGTGLYLKALTEGLSNLTIPVDPELRENLEKLSLLELQKKLQEISPGKLGNMNNSDRQNPRRLIRAIEISTLSLRGAKRRSNLVKTGKIASLIARNDILKIGLTAPREVLYQRIDERVESRIEQGLVEEAKKLHKEGLSLKRMRQLGLEYGVLADYLEGKITSEEELARVLQGKIHNYARRQITWFKREKEVFWFDISRKSWVSLVESQVDSWYYCCNDKAYRHLI